MKLARKDFLLPLEVVGFAQSYLLGFMSQNPKGVSAAVKHQTSWHHPPINSIKINFDGGLLDGGRGVGLGVIARDAAGLCLAWLSLRLNRGGSMELAEDLAAREAIRLARRYWWLRVILEGDCSTLLHMLSSPELDFSVTQMLGSFLRF
ncbi:uncharacterized protein LOC105171849 [Sesamum indicum]|uniref:Uncharacterized protein LOC105171849 n=1 Tax=Sesamum indicum TaxID=4182 RepID=A0A8M8V2E2_SESIN|nr:uncharacterized protein LOC105171849 [Sesamum indicum]